MSSTHTVLYDPTGRTDELPLDRDAHRNLVQAALAWAAAPKPAAADLQHIVLQLTGAARAVASDVRRAANRLPADHPALALADVVLAEADRRLSVPPQATVRCAHNRARLVRALYERLDRLTDVALATSP
ncbi:restriction endonuclease [Streptomyces chrestomyceticus]|uniref:restriction endonuclease n=1 Tax=Streptomyces chrestomyceticus TaxID=68185 RepID=UPI0036BFFDDB